MEVLRDLYKFSTHRPTKGLKHKLLNLAIDDNLNRKEAIAHFEILGKKEQFNVIYKRLKDALLKGVSDNSFENLSDQTSKARFKIWKKHLQTKILFQLGGRESAVKLAIETIVLAEKQDQFEVIQSLCSILTNHFSIIQPNLQKFKKFQSKLDIASSILNDELRIKAAYHDLMLRYNKNKNIDHIPKVISELVPIAKNNNHPRFKYLYYSIISVYHQIINDQEKVISNNSTAYNFFSNQKKTLSYVYQYTFLSDLIPIYILQKKFKETASILEICISLPPFNSFNHHKILIYQAYFGFRSDTPQLVTQAYEIAHAVPTKFQSNVIEKRWHLIKGYLALYQKFGLVSFYKEFRLQKFLNVPENQGDNIQKANLIILELLHLLMTKNFPIFITKLDRVEPFITTRFKSHDFKRTRFFLRMLKAIVKGNYTKKLVLAHAESQTKKLTESNKEFNIDTIEREIVPYEILWNLIIQQLR